MVYYDFGKQLFLHVNKFINSLDENHEAVIVASGITVKEFSLDDSGLIIFYGECNGQPAQVIQSFDQININLFSIEVPEDRPKNNIKFGFQQSDNNKL